ncbi:uncharacterized protein LACBIDRAFT_306718 [Laccaria bicolor S238N-H82]|uniref:Predicted protein n=1 Tax=Laccaria bicolor (strain S238N-H82 / ATCC MYA-4686) TaxID=486041 RepID=B0E4I0_LACBS|nr:uncharacterized protein LACBIDRAFT_306718 [Laccaria bicolor S238N-H82]EDQ98247.1 predicted protein [Laccaria bicolor S238N-H82]|eukprot:XP_001891098.1 predicted protein [Laccaria bicolor S238N-H82]
MHSPPSTPSTPSEPSFSLLPSASTLQATQSQPSNPSTKTDNPPCSSARIRPVNLAPPIRNQSTFMWQANLMCVML